jgi:DegV family protein with EDD domain
MSKIAIVTDSTAYLPIEIIEKYDITVIPLMVNFGQQSYREGQDIQPGEFYEMLTREKVFPTTSQPAVGEVVAAFERLLETHDSVIALFISAGLSGTVNSAEAAARMVGGDITVIDSKITAAGLAYLVKEACKMREAGLDKQAIVDKLLELREGIKAYFVVDSLEHLHRGGRIGGVSAAIGTLLQVKPILHVKEGKLELLEKVRTRKKAFARAFELIRENSEAGKPLTIQVVYTSSKADGEALLEQTKAEFPQATVELVPLGPVIGAHVGPGMMALLFYPA